MMPRIHCISVLCGDIQTRLGDNTTYVRVLRISQTIFLQLLTFLQCPWASIFQTKVKVLLSNIYVSYNDLKNQCIDE